MPFPVWNQKCYNILDADINAFSYHIRKFEPNSLLWRAWLCIPQSLRLVMYRVLIRRGGATGSPRVFRLPFGLYAKFGDDVTVSEALATQFVGLNTTIPVPTILDVLKSKDMGVLFVMSAVPGRPLSDMGETLDTVSAEQVSSFAKTVWGWIDQIRQLPPPQSGAVCGILGTSFISYRIHMDGHVGPFSSVDEFHAQPYCSLPAKSDPAIQALATSVRAKPSRLCFTHGDISPHNILVDDNYRPVGLVDWQCAAWMPEYWELTTALWRRQRYTAWFNGFREACPHYADELAIEMELWKTICPF